ncbi:prephenate dehydrogenase [Micromonospora echinofusca]|uniref:Prephenate dehydrogenase/arogenate dehydrogenase family protein n=1 Tax=Micromonospora echinofusca TaxID=47858 RepID=A0ABS3VNM3_MICEH|nr:prephenate dehydrogenase/arogenate dehydrogenase family protein [Micromonospora echinofusca]MBO4206092.1 prephenate dehydrogenase/arogenate dehydrogenase family protein [Micromonospora echinofusca]
MVETGGAPLRAAVVGTGLIGGSILLRLHRAGLPVSGWDPDPATRAEGRRQGLTFPDELADAVRDRDVVFLGAPLAALPEMLARIGAGTGADCVLTDVGSTKSAVAAAATAHGLAHRFVPGHPMAGAERAGLVSAVPDLFAGAAWVLCPTAETLPGPFRKLAALIVDVFGARIVPMSPTVHDSVVALASHVPHLLAGGLAGATAGSPVRDAVLGLAAGSFRDGTRVAGTPAKRTVDMLLSNRAEVLAQLAGVTAFLDGLTAALRSADGDRLLAYYRRAQALRASLPERRFTRSRRSFPLAGPLDEELRFLLELGAAGGHLTGCEVRDATVTYLVHRPDDDEPGGDGVAPLG